MMMLLPLFGGRGFPPQLRLALAGAIAIFVAPTLHIQSAPMKTVAEMVLLFASEVVVGLLLGFLARMIFFAIEVAGNIITYEMALNMASSFNPLSEFRTDAPSILLFYFAAVLFFTLDLHHWVLAAFRHSYEILGPGIVTISNDTIKYILIHSASIFILALKMSAPVLAVSFLTALLISILSRAVPQMNILADTFPLRLMIGLISFGFAINMLAQHIANGLRQIPYQMLEIVRYLAG